jgi:hypothetical protein
VPAHQELATREPAPGEVVPVAEAEPEAPAEDEVAEAAEAEVTTSAGGEDGTVA